jgi:hypothetical protein
MYCCSNCFSDRFLESHIEAIGEKVGDCSFCGQKGTKVLPPVELSDYFLPLFDIYKENSKGFSLAKILQDDWKVFGSMTSRKQTSLVNQILPGFNISKRKFCGRVDKNEAILEQWAQFSDELKHVNRFTPEHAPEMDLFTRFAPFLGKRFAKGELSFFRARINSGKDDFSKKEMQKPPNEIATNGRANPIGISYLYVASDKDTAIAEVRGHKGEMISVMDFTLNGSIELFDLRDPQNTISPFEQLDELEFLYTHMPFLLLLGDELAKPVIPSRANLDYLSSQYLCEMIKHIGYQGIIFKSSIADGYNYVIFKDNSLKAGSIRKYQISAMKYVSIPV